MNVWVESAIAARDATRLQAEYEVPHDIRKERRHARRSGILDVAIGIVFIYLLLSLVCTIINEGIASTINQRGRGAVGGARNGFRVSDAGTQSSVRRKMSNWSGQNFGPPLP
jgi:hypothetical protein